MKRPLCKCGNRPVAINYYKEKRPYYRSKCDVCLRYGVGIKGLPLWYQQGYRKKSQCEKCGYKSKHHQQFDVFHLDGNLSNCKITNLKTVCANCQRLLHLEGITWRQGDLQPDF